MISCIIKEFHCYIMKQELFSVGRPQNQVLITACHVNIS